MRNRSLSMAMLQAKCPRCREGDLFPTSVFSYRKLSDIHGKCPICDATITPEPDFFYGAMYISYAFSVALVVNVFIILSYFFDDPEVMVYVWTVLVANILLVPLMLRYSKVLYLYGLGKLKYDPDAADKALN
ncbi:hypothetical protein A33Q_2881 [Indibacter alkaliphilus LW1]|jgi:uncharacterized protein (DUF983 family)|uniref:DUF983 domain-containing protein n=1 Tax=Indibacter alkaliphilus (strain CCUG 57479 / KCTC 22604 / LW1) TaxID=1189612 RepID=S2D9H2_INDAL|nr:DUF983 domain-containing protein [Indibacter alkaliphilus]EOZ95519.1 hypothetical protein A33Q_2881 [Indibacter alkaliphilus LW1]